MEEEICPCGCGLSLAEAARQVVETDEVLAGILGGKPKTFDEAVEWIRESDWSGWNTGNRIEE